MRSVDQQILDYIEEALNPITIGNGYNTHVKKVFVGKLIQPERFSEYERESLIQVRWSSKENARAGDRAGQVHMESNSNFMIVASMTNVTHEVFTGFLTDIEASLAKTPNMDLYSGAFKVMDSFVNDVTITSTTESDELEDTYSKDIREQVAELTFNVQYIYIADQLSGN